MHFMTDINGQERFLKMREIEGLPAGIKVFTDFMSFSEAEMYIDAVESASSSECGAKWGIPETHSPDISFLRGNEGINISQHGFMNAECSCGLKELDGMLGEKMLQILTKYTSDYSIGFSQDEGFIITKQSKDHVSEIVIDDNPFVNRVISYHFAMNVEDPINYINFINFDLEITVKQPSIIVFPSNFIYSYEKMYHEGLYEVINFFNNNPTDEIFNEAFIVEQIN